MYTSNNTIVCYAKTTDPWFVDHIDRWSSILNPEDTHRYNITKNKKSRKQFLLGRILLFHSASALGHAGAFTEYSNPSFHEVVFDKTCYYKSVSHSEDCAIVFLSTIRGKLGIDIETIKERDFCGIANAYFCPKERDQLQEYDFNPEHFYRLWTAKEAYIKAESAKMLVALQLDFSNILTAHPLKDNILCYQLRCYQHVLGNQIISIMAQHPSLILNQAPTYVSDLPAPHNQ